MTRNVENRLHLKRRLYHFQLKEISIGEYINSYTNFLADVVNREEVINDEDKTLILLSSRPNEEYETFIFALINDKQSLSYNKVSAALVNHEIRRKDEESSNSTSAKALVARAFNHRKGKRDISKLKIVNWKRISKEGH